MKSLRQGFGGQVFLERALLVIGLSCLGWYGMAAADAAYEQQEARAELERMIDERPAAAAPIDSRPLPSPEVLAFFRPTAPMIPELGSRLVGLLEIPRLGISTAVVSGDDKEALHAGAGHLPDTPRPWEMGNSAIAAHRDTLFRPLKDIRIGDELQVRTPHGDLRYKVKKTRIVKPSDLSVLAPTKGQTLTLITCYPFYYVGSAPKRFIVQADRIDGQEAVAGTGSGDSKESKRKRLLNSRRSR